MHSSRFQNICLVRLSALGDVVHALALANGLKKALPDSKLTWVLQPLSFEIVKHQSNIDRFLICDIKKKPDSRKDFYRQLREERFDLAIIPQVSFRAGRIAAMLNADVKLGFDFRRSRELNWLFVNKRIPYHPPQHVQDQFFEFLDYLKIDHREPEWNITFTESERLWRDAFFRKIGKRVVSFVIATSDPRKDWSPEGYAAVMDYVAASPSFQPMIIGGPSRREAQITEKILSFCKCSPVIALEKPVRHTLLQLSGSALVISPDTGPLHMAVALDVPTISLYGASDPRRCGPYRKFHDLLINTYADPGESDTVITRKLRNRMDRITPEAVIEKIDYAMRTYLNPDSKSN